MARLLGSWMWLLLIRRPCLSVFSACYTFIQTAGRTPRARQVPPDALRELRTAVGISPLIVADMKTPFSNTILASDASGLGGGVTYAHTSSEDARTLAARHAAAGWYTCLNHDTEETPRLDMAPEALQLVQTASWRTAVSHRWRHSSHINILEANAVLLGLRWYSSKRRRFHTRVPILVDSAVVVGALAKGRSSSTRLQRQCRRVAAMCLATGIRPYYVWVPTQHNPADRPSRHFGPRHQQQDRLR